MERTLQVLDCAILVISGADGVQAHTRTLCPGPKLLRIDRPGAVPRQALQKFLHALQLQR